MSKLFGRALNSIQKGLENERIFDVNPEFFHDAMVHGVGKWFDNVEWIKNDIRKNF